MTHNTLEENSHAIWFAVGALAVALGLAIAFAAGTSGIAAAQQTSPTAEVPGLDAGETGNITVEVVWNGNATANDTATVSIDYVTDAGTGELEQTDTHTINASPSNTTTSTYAVTPDQHVELFEVTTEAVAQNVSSVTVTSDIQADTNGTDGSGGGGGGSLTIGGSPITGGHVLLAVIAIVVVGIVLDRRGS